MGGWGEGGYPTSAHQYRRTRHLRNPRSSVDQWGNQQGIICVQQISFKGGGEACCATNDRFFLFLTTIPSCKRCHLPMDADTCYTVSPRRCDPRSFLYREITYENPFTRVKLARVSAVGNESTLTSWAHKGSVKATHTQDTSVCLACRMINEGGWMSLQFAAHAADKQAVLFGWSDRSDAVQVNGSLFRPQPTKVSAIYYVMCLVSK